MSVAYELFEALDHHRTPHLRLICTPDASTVLPTNVPKDDVGNVHLDFGYGMPTPILGQRTDSDGLSAVLDFSGTSFTVYIPWGRVIAIAWGDGVAYFTRQDAPKKGLRLVK